MIKMSYFNKVNKTVYAMLLNG